MSLTIKQYLEQYVKPTAIKLGGIDAADDIAGGGGGGGISSVGINSNPLYKNVNDNISAVDGTQVVLTANGFPVGSVNIPLNGLYADGSGLTNSFYIPDFEDIVTDVFYILMNDPVDLDDAVWANFDTPRVVNATPIAKDLYNRGFYQDVVFEGDGNKYINIGYSGVANFGAFDTQDGPFVGANYLFTGEIDPSTGDAIDNIELSIQSGFVTLNYVWEYDEGDDEILVELLLIGGQGGAQLVLSFNTVIDAISNEAISYDVSAMGAN